MDANLGLLCAHLQVYTTKNWHLPMSGPNFIYFFLYTVIYIAHFHSSMLKCAVQVMRWQDTRTHRPAICMRNRCTHYVQSVSNRSWPKPQLS